MKPTRIPSLKRKQISDTLGNEVPVWYTFSLLFDWKNIFDLDAKKPQPSDSKVLRNPSTQIKVRKA